MSVNSISEKEYNTIMMYLMFLLITGISISQRKKIDGAKQENDCYHGSPLLLFQVLLHLLL